MTTIKIKWQPEDGFLGGARPQSFTMKEDDFDGCETIEEAMALVDEEVQNDFEQKVTTSYDRNAIQKQVEDMMAKRKN